MKRIATSKDMLYEQKLAQDFQQQFPQIGEALAPLSPGVKEIQKGLDVLYAMPNSPGRDAAIEALTKELEQLGGRSAKTAETDDWDEVQENLRNDVYGAWHNIRSHIAEKWGQENPGEGLGSSDINHIAYDMVKSGELVPADDPRTPRVANNRDRVAEVWKQVEQSIYQGPDSALPEVIEILESIPEVIALAATREREPSLQEQNAAEMDAELAAEQRYLDQGL